VLILDGNSNPYCEVKIGEGNQYSCIEKTKKIKNTKNPSWKEVFTLNVNNPMTETLYVEILSKESRGKDNSLGFSSMMLNDLTRGIEKQLWLQLEGGTQSTNIIGQIASHLGKKKEKENKGKVFLGVTALDFGLDPSTFPPGSQQQGMQQPAVQQQPQVFEGQQQQPMQQQAGAQQQYSPQQFVGQQQPMQGGVQQYEGSQQQPQQCEEHPPQQLVHPPQQSGQPVVQQQPQVFEGQQQQPMQQQGMQQQGMQQPGMQYPPPSSSGYDAGFKDVYPKTL